MKPRKETFWNQRNVTINHKFSESQTVQKSHWFLKLIPLFKVLTSCADNKLKSDINRHKYPCMLLFRTSFHRIFLNLKQYYLIHQSCVANTHKYVAIYISKGLFSSNDSPFFKYMALFGPHSLNFDLLFISHIPKMESYFIWCIYDPVL